MASTSPAWASLVTSLTPARPRATRSAKNEFQAVLVSEVATWRPRSVGGDERERAGLAEGAVSELVDVLVELGGHPGHLGLRQPVDAQGFDELVHPARGHPGQVAVRDHGDQGRLGALAISDRDGADLGLVEAGRVSASSRCYLA
jgi:hypothetical protein